VIRWECVVWIWFLVSIFTDIVRSEDMSGWSKAIWAVAIIVLPILGSLIYLIARGDKMGERAVRAAQRQEDAFQSYVRQTAGTPSVADELTKLVDLRSSGALDEAEFARLKARLVES
jgi:Phospholipase_D-nuclease N-terminal